MTITLSPAGNGSKPAVGLINQYLLPKLAVKETLLWLNGGLVWRFPGYLVKSDPHTALNRECSQRTLPSVGGQERKNSISPLLCI